MYLPARHRLLGITLLAFAAVDFFALRDSLRAEEPTVEVRPPVNRQERSLATSPRDSLHAEVAELEKVTYGGKLSDSDYETIVQLVASHKRLFERNILSIEVRRPNQVEVTTGPKNLKPLSGGGNFITLRKLKGLWFVVELGIWVG